MITLLQKVLAEAVEFSENTDKKVLFRLGQQVNSAFDHPGEVGLRPKPEHFKTAAKKLGIKPSQAAKAWHHYTWGHMDESVMREENGKEPEKQKATATPKHKHNADTFHRWGGKGSYWAQLKDKVRMEDEIPGNDQAELCPDCGKRHAHTVPCPGKKLLDELGEAAGQTHPFSKALGEHVRHSTDQSGRIVTLRGSGPLYGPKNSSDGHSTATEAMVEASKIKSSKKYDVGADVRAIARERVGPVQGRKVMTPKNKKALKYKDRFDEEESPSE